VVRMLSQRLKLVVLLPIVVSLIAPLALARAQHDPPDPRFGIVEAFWDTTAAVEAGVAWERILFLWSQIQPNGPDDWNTLHVPDEWLQWAQIQGREVVGLLKNTPYWATDASPPMEASPPRGLDLPVDDPGNVWAAFVRRVVAFYGARGVHRWIIWNEPDIAPGVYGQEWGGSIEAYYRLLKVAYLAIKEVDPDAHVHLAGLTFWHDQGWLRKFLAVATADPEGAAHDYFFDVVSLHIYFQTDSVDYVVNRIRADLAAYGLNKPIWINETNASPDTDPLWPIERPRWRVDLTEQASFILQSYALGLAAGAERIGVYKLIDAGLPPGGEPFGLLRPDHSRRPAYTAYRLATQLYAGTRSAHISRDPQFTQVTLNRGERTTRVFWARTATDVSVTVPALSVQAILVDQEGNADALDGSSGAYFLTLPGARCADEVLGCIIGGPTYLLVEESAAADIGAPAVFTPTPAADIVTVEPKVVAIDVTVSATATLRPTGPAVTLRPTVTATAAPSPTATVTPSPSATPMPSPTMTATPSPTPRPSETATRTATQSPVPSDTPTLSPIPLPTVTPSPISSSRALDSVGSLAIVGLIAVLAAGLVVFILRKTRRDA
jgi:hypothetical protein